MKQISGFFHRCAGLRHGAMIAAIAFAVVVPLFAPMASPMAAPYVHLVAGNEASKKAQPHPGEVDPVITGNTVDESQRAEWERKRRKFLECGLCGKEQAFPEDL